VKNIHMLTDFKSFTTDRLLLINLNKIIAYEIKGTIKYEKDFVKF